MAWSMLPLFPNKKTQPSSQSLCGMFQLWEADGLIPCGEYRKEHEELSPVFSVN